MATKKAASVTPDSGHSNPRTIRRPAAAIVRRPQPAAVATVDRPRVEDGDRRLLAADRESDSARALRERMRARVIGQDAAIRALVRSWDRLRSGMRDPGRPLLTALLMGPTGVGKTETARALATALFNDEAALHRINCEEYAHGHEVAKLLGSPPGYVGADIEPLLSQRLIDRPHAQLRLAADRKETPSERPLIDEVLEAGEGLHSIILFDEVEKAHPTVWNALLGILEDGKVTLGNNATTDLTRSVILLTTNVGSRELGAAIGRVPLGFAGSRKRPDESLSDIAEAAARQIFPIEFLNRFDEILVYERLGAAELGAIFDKFLNALNQRAREQAGVPLLIKASTASKAHVIEAGTDPTLGARPLRRAMERLIVDPVSRLLATGELTSGDVIEVELESGELCFYRLPRSTTAIVA